MWLFSFPMVIFHKNICGKKRCEHRFQDTTPELQKGSQTEQALFQTNSPSALMQLYTQNILFANFFHNLRLIPVASRPEMHDKDVKLFIKSD